MRYHVVLFTREGTNYPVGATDDLGLSWLILNWYAEERLVAGEQMGIRDTLRRCWECPPAFAEQEV
jgi:hypothetical protein